jgi:RNA polymerase sigma-70 factor, ECF subfamily
MGGTGLDFDDFYRAQHGAVVATVWRVTGDGSSAEDIAQEAFAKALVRWRRVGRFDKPGAWVRRVAIRDAVRAVNRSRRSGPLPAEPPWPAPPVVLDDPELAAAITTLPGNQRAAIVLYYLEDRSTGEVAELLGCGEATVRVHLRRARARLADALAGTHRSLEVPDVLG